MKLVQAGEGKFTRAELLEKARILDEVGFTKEGKTGVDGEWDYRNF